MNNPLRHVGQTARPEDPQAPAAQPGDAAAQSLPQHPTEKSDQADAQLPTPAGKKDIPDLKPGEPPPESSAGS
ncbi:hypothetical protein [Roseateles sp. P5_E11]